jgi:hypothetical protein
MVENPRPDEVILQQMGDHLERARQFITGNPEAAAARAIEGIRDAEGVEAQIADQLAAASPLASVDSFLPAHRQAIRALEVLDREGTRNPRIGRLWGPLTPLIAAGVEYVADYIVKGYASDVVGSMHRLYVRREAQCSPGTPERRMLAQARVEAKRLSDDFKGGGLGVPTLLAGGLLFPLIAGVGDRLVGLDFTSRTVLLAGAVIFWLVSVMLAGMLLRGAAVAHRRSRLIMRQPLLDLWAAVGRAGNPPEDDSTPFAIGAVVLTAIAWLLLPGAAVAVFIIG